MDDHGVTAPKDRLATILRTQESFGDVPVEDHVVDLVSLACLHMRSLGRSTDEIAAVLQKLAAKVCAPGGLAGAGPPFVDTPGEPVAPSRGIPVATVITAEIRLEKTQDGNIVLDLSAVPVSARPEVQAYFGDVLAGALMNVQTPGVLSAEVSN